ncbi:hypothetical protein [Acetobacterium sp.]|uniref:hypothetical protein n=1 Tax=Acetobacterium sp. TaxID=1872094 RepID=UPI003593DB64
MENIWNYHHIMGIIVSLIYVFSVIFLAKFLERFGKEASRKAVLATLLEAVTPLGMDNLTVPLVSAGAYYFLFV